MAKIDDFRRLLEEAKVEKALKLAEEIKDKGKVAEALNDVAVFLLWETNYFSEAINLLQKAVEVKPDFPVPYNNLGLIYSDLVMEDPGKWGEAESMYRRAIELDPKYAEPLYNLSVLLYSSSRLDEALEEHNKAVRITPDDERFKFLGLLLEAEQSEKK